jgi:hypothetical protein
MKIAAIVVGCLLVAILCDLVILKMVGVLPLT